MEVCLYTYYLFYCSISLTFPCGSTEKFAQRVCTKCVTVVRERERERVRGKEGGALILTSATFCVIQYCLCCFYISSAFSIVANDDNQRPGAREREREREREASVYVYESDWKCSPLSLLYIPVG